MGLHGCQPRSTVKGPEGPFPRIPILVSQPAHRAAPQTRVGVWTRGHTHAHRAASWPGPQSQPEALRPAALRQPGRTHKVTFCQFLQQASACCPHLWTRTFSIFPRGWCISHTHANVCTFTHRSHMRTHTHTHANRCTGSITAAKGTASFFTKSGSGASCSGGPPASRWPRQGFVHAKGRRGQDSAFQGLPKPGQAPGHCVPLILCAEPGGRSPPAPQESARPRPCTAAHPTPSLY